MQTKILIKLIQIIHLSLIIYIFVGPFYKDHIDTVIGLLLFILFRWITNNNQCTLTMIENKLAGKNKGFISRIVNPIYKLNESKMNRIIYFVTITWLLLLTIIKLEKLKI